MKHARLLIAATLIGLLTPSIARALRSGDDAAELKVDFVANGPVALTPPSVDKRYADRLKVLVIFRTEGASSQDLLQMLQELRLRYPRVTFVALTSDPRELAMRFYERMPNPDFTTAVDTDGKDVRQYMAGSMIYPAAFVIDYRGRIIWNGEAIDLPEMLEEFYTGKFDEDKAAKVSPLLDDLQSRMRSGEDRMADFAVRKVLAVDPANSAALRLRLFMLENSNRVTAAWNLLADQLRANPKERKFYLMQLDLALRHAQFAPQIGALTQLYLKHIAADPASDAALAWILLTRAPFDSMALSVSGTLVNRALAAEEKGEPTLATAEVWNCAALYASRIGKLTLACEYQKKTIALLKKLAPHRAAAAQEQLKYYETAVSLERQ